ncbi:MAG: Maf family protein [Bacteroidota bacterium]|nr:Maf family protein [Bacteroidota bacterium]
MTLLSEKIKPFHVILGSKSPRRHELLKHIIPHFDIVNVDINEDFPKSMAINEVAQFIAEKKANYFLSKQNSNEIYITADTIVVLDNEILGKPKDENDAYQMLKSLSGKTHLVHTGVAILHKQKIYSFFDETAVTFYPLSDIEINNYIKHCKPFDKAGSYGIQDWMGYVGIQKMEGDFFNVMGLPLHRLYRELNAILN